LADDKLRPVFGGKDKVSMFEMNKHLSRHVG
jgi:chromatin remodeling complex protein RSC6